MRHVRDLDRDLSEPRPVLQTERKYKHLSIGKRAAERRAPPPPQILPFKDWGKLFHNAAAASAIADRLLHRGLLIEDRSKSKCSDEEVEST